MGTVQTLTFEIDELRVLIAALLFFSRLGAFIAFLQRCQFLISCPQPEKCWGRLGGGDVAWEIGSGGLFLCRGTPSKIVQKTLPTPGGAATEEEAEALADVGRNSPFADVSAFEPKE